MRLAAVLASAALLSGAASAAQPKKPLCRGCSVVFVSFDALQAAHVHALGGSRPTTPVFDGLAARGVLFTQAITAAPWTLPATMSWFTGTYPSLHRVVNKFSQAGGQVELSDLRRLSPDAWTLGRTFKAAGYATGGFTGDAGVNGAFGFNDGFDVYSDSVPPFSGFNRSIPKALEWARSVKDGPFLLFLHGYGDHGQYEPDGGLDRRFVDPGYAGRYDGSAAQQRELREAGLRGAIELGEKDVALWRAVYDEKIARSDAEFGLFVSSMEAMGALKRTILVLTSDHGDEFYEHGGIDHGATLYDELARVPLAIVLPGVRGGRVVGGQVSSIDLLPTLLELTGVEPSPALRRQMKGRSLVPLMTGRDARGEDVLLETDYRLFTRKRGLRTADGWKFIMTMESGKKELYDLSRDPQERENLAETRPRVAYELEQRLFRRYKDFGVDLDKTSWALGCSPVYADQCK